MNKEYSIERHERLRLGCVNLIDATEGLCQLKDKSAGLIIADCYAFFDKWPKEAIRVLKPNGTLIMSLCETAAVLGFCNFISRFMSLVGAMQSREYYRCDDKAFIWWIFKLGESRPVGFYELGGVVPSRVRLFDIQRSIQTMTVFVSNFSKPSDLVVDICAGTGTAAIACSRLGRYYIGFDHYPDIVNAAERRLWGKWRKPDETMPNHWLKS